MAGKDIAGGKLNQGPMWFPGILVWFLLVQACSSIAYVQINDRLPAKANALEGKQIFLAVEDERKTKDFAGKGVKREFENFSESISYSVKTGSEPSVPMGLYDVPALVKEALRLRLQNEGAQILSEEKAGQVEMVVVLQEFSLDLVDRTWKIRLGYEARLVKNGEVLAKQFVNGEAERLKLLGTEQADAVVGDLFADVMNRLNVPKLFHDAGL
jgi:hypothetical protein